MRKQRVQEPFYVRPSFGLLCFGTCLRSGFEDFGTGGPFAGGSTSGYPIDIGFYPVGGGGTFEIQDLGNPAGFGNRTLHQDASGATMMIFNFSIALTAVSIDMGDFNADDDDLYMEAYDAWDAGGSPVDSDYEFYAGSRDIANCDKATLSCARHGRGFGSGRTRAASTAKVSRKPRRT